MKKIELSMAYAVGAGTGAARIAMIGFVHFKEDLTTAKIACIVLIIAGVVGLNPTGNMH